MSCINVYFVLLPIIYHKVYVGRIVTRQRSGVAWSKKRFIGEKTDGGVTKLGTADDGFWWNRISKLVERLWRYWVSASMVYRSKYINETRSSSIVFLRQIIMNRKRCWGGDLQDLGWWNKSSRVPGLSREIWRGVWLLLIFVPGVVRVTLLHCFAFAIYNST